MLGTFNRDIRETNILLNKTSKMTQFQISVHIWQGEKDSSRATGILILIGSLGCLKEAETMDMILGWCKFPNRFPYFQ